MPKLKLENCKASKKIKFSQNPSKKDGELPRYTVNGRYLEMDLAPIPTNREVQEAKTLIRQHLTPRFTFNQKVRNFILGAPPGYHLTPREEDVARGLKMHFQKGADDDYSQRRLRQQQRGRSQSISTKARTNLELRKLREERKKIINDKFIESNLMDVAKLQDPKYQHLGEDGEAIKGLLSSGL